MQTLLNIVLSSFSEPSPFRFLFTMMAIKKIAANSPIAPRQIPGINFHYVLVILVSIGSTSLWVPQILHRDTLQEVDLAFPL